MNRKLLVKIMKTKIMGRKSRWEKHIHYLQKRDKRITADFSSYTYC